VHLEDIYFHTFGVFNVSRTFHKYKIVVTRCVLTSSKCTKTRFRPVLRPGPGWGSLRRSPRPLSRLGRGTLPIPLPLDAFGVSISAPTAPRAPPLFWSSLRPCFAISKQKISGEGACPNLIYLLTYSLTYLPCFM